MAADFASGRRDRALARPGATCSRTWCASPTRRRRGLSLALSRDRRGQARPAVELPAPARPGRRLPDRLRLGGRARSGGAPPRAVDAPVLRARAAPRALGGAPGRAWERGRYEGPYLRDELLDLGYLAETLETAHTWSRLGELYDAVRAAIGAALATQGTPGLVMCHLSHAYRDGASLYFTFLARSPTRRRARAVARRQDGGLRGDRRGGGDDHPSPRRSAATTSPTCAPRSASWGSRPCAPSRSASIPTGIMNPGKLIPYAPLPAGLPGLRARARSRAAFLIELIPRAPALPQNRLGGIWYSTWNTALPARVNAL